MNIHLIAIGGSIMHNLALSLKKNGINVTGSDDMIFEPSRSRLKNKNLLPEELGWFPNKIHTKLDGVILGMHAQHDNSELKKAQEIGIPIYSYPEYIYNNSQHKKRIVIGGSHGKTSITSMILHVFKNCKIDSDYIVGAQIDGFDRMVKLTDEAKIIVLEGDEYLSSPIDKRPKFHLYKPHIAVLSGIAWDHINVFPTYKNYVKQFKIFIEDIKDLLIYYENDTEILKIIKNKTRCDIKGYSTPEYEIKGGITYLTYNKNLIPLKIFGKHNLQNINAAKLVCNEIGISDKQFHLAISTFTGAKKRLELVLKNKYSAVYTDFAHSPSKLKATTTAMKRQFPERKLIACLELYTFSSLTKDFLVEYKNCMNDADLAIVYFNPNIMKKKQLQMLREQDIKKAFGRQDLNVISEITNLENYLCKLNWKNQNLVMMSSGDFNCLDINSLAEKILNTT
ncbi:MAG: Mur ligase family protein [Bacteroidota bacterium]|nr:Mur ligase family protein [Bacteroidota bacterium]